jgi:four helix bundle protein
MAGFRNHEELDCWQLSHQVRLRVREILERPGFRRKLDLRVQLEKVAESPCPNIAEGFARYLPRDNCRFVCIAAGSLNELPDHLNRAEARQLISPTECNELTALAQRALAATSGYAAYLRDAKPPRPRRRLKRPRPNPEPEPGTANVEPGTPNANAERGNVEPGTAS